MWTDGVVGMLEGYKGGEGLKPTGREANERERRSERSSYNFVVQGLAVKVGLLLSPSMR